MIHNRAHPKVADKLKELIKDWAHTEFKEDPSLSLIPSLYQVRPIGLGKRPSIDHSVFFVCIYFPGSLMPVFIEHILKSCKIFVNTTFKLS